jgi:hypothetical protein
MRETQRLLDEERRRLERLRAEVRFGQITRPRRRATDR